MSDLISVIIPVYNVEKYVEKTVLSILNNAYPNIEVICVNDGSTDNSLAVLQAIAQTDERVKVFDKQNGGVTSARLYGLEQARGTWISFIDGDDTIDTDMYERLIANVTAEDIDISHCGYKKYFWTEDVRYYYNTGKKLEQDTYTGCKDLLEGVFIEPGLVNKLYKRELFIGLNEWLDSSIKMNEDLLMNFYLFRKSRKSVYEDFCPYNYVVRWGSASTSHIREFMLYDPIRVADLLIGELSNEAELQWIVQKRLVALLINGATYIADGHHDIVKPFRKYALKRLKEKRKEILSNKQYSKKIRLSTIWVCLWPASYRWAHILYGIMTGKRKKYNGATLWY